MGGVWRRGVGDGRDLRGVALHVGRDIPGRKKTISVKNTRCISLQIFFKSSRCCSGSFSLDCWTPCDRVLNCVTEMIREESQLSSIHTQYFRESSIAHI